MSAAGSAFTGWLILVLLAVPYTGFIKHRDTHHGVVFVVFVFLFSVIAWMASAVLSLVLTAPLLRHLDDPDAAGVIWLAACASGLAVAHWQAARPPRQARLD